MSHKLKEIQYTYVSHTMYEFSDFNYSYLVFTKLYSLINNIKYTSNAMPMFCKGFFVAQNYKFILYQPFVNFTLLSGFGIGSVIYSGLQFGQYFELSSSLENDCDNILKALKPLAKIIFALMQMLFIFSYSNVSVQFVRD